MDPTGSDPRDCSDPREVLRTDAGRALVDQLTPYDPGTTMARLEQARAQPAWADHPEVVAAAATQARLRTRAAARFPGPTRWWTPEGLEQATRPMIAAQHAQRFVAAGVTRVLDLGAGIGSDSLALTQAGLHVIAVDRDPDALWALRATAGDRGLTIDIRRGDVTALLEHLLAELGTGVGADRALGLLDRSGAPGHRGLGCFVDPSRRRDGRRVLDPAGWSPPWSWVADLAARVPRTGAKIAPGIDHGLLPPGTQTQWTSVGGELLEAAVWWGPLRRGPAARIATVLGVEGAGGTGPGGGRADLDDAEGIPVPEVGPCGAWLVEPDPAVIRAGLVSVLAGRLDGRLLDPRIAYIATSTPADPGLLGTSYEVLEELPFARKQLRAWLRRHGYGNVVIKKRGVAIVPEQLRAALRLGGDGPTATLVLTRTDAGPLALLVQRRSS